MIDNRSVFTSDCQSPCESFPCQHGGTCQALYDKHDHRCTCKQTYNGKNCEVFKTPCTPVGVADRNIIPDDKMTASSTHPDDLPHLGRVNETRHNGVWCTEQNQIDGDYLQVDLGVVHSVCAVATQGPRNELWVKSFKLQFSTDGAIWNFYHENTNQKVFEVTRNGIVQHSVSNFAEGRFVRFYPITYQHWPCLAVEVFVLS